MRKANPVHYNNSAGETSRIRKLHESFGATLSSPEGQLNMEPENHALSDDRHGLVVNHLNEVNRYVNEESLHEFVQGFNEMEERLGYVKKNRLKKKTLNESDRYYSQCAGEVFGSDICAIGGEGYYSELSDSESQKLDKVYDAANKIADACKCFKGGIFTDWDEDVVKSSLENVPSGSEDDLKDLLYCYMKGAPDSMFNKLKPNYNPVDALIRTLTPKTQYFDSTDWRSVSNKYGVDYEDVRAIISRDMEK